MIDAIVESFNDLPVQVILSGLGFDGALSDINAHSQGPMSTAGGQAQMVAVNAEKGVDRGSPHVPKVT